MVRGCAALAVAVLLGIAAPVSGQTRQIAGKVTDADGQPVAGAVVEVTSLSGAVVGFVDREQRRAGGQKYRATTNVNGDYGVAVAVSGVYLVVASKDSVGTDQREIVVRFGSVPSVNLRLAKAVAAATANIDCATPGSNAAFEGSAAVAAAVGSHPALIRLLRWLDTVRSHTAGCPDSPLREIGAWAPADLETLLADVANIAAFQRWVRESPDEANATVRTSIDSLTGGPRRQSEASFVRDPNRGAAIHLYTQRFDLEVIEKIFHGNETLRRGALLHADIAIFVPGDFQRYPTVDDGRSLSARPGTVHWQIGRQLLDTISPAPRADAGALLWYRAVSAHFFRQGQLAEATQHLAKARRVFPNHAELLLDSAYLHLELSSPAIQTAVGELRAAGTGVLVDTRRNELQYAERFLRDTLRVAPGNTEARYRLGHTLGELGRYPDAAAELRQVIDAQPVDEQLYLAELFLGRQEQALGRRDEAKRRYENAAAIFPNAQSPQLALGHLARESGDRAAALSALRTITTAPDGNREDPWLWYYKPHLTDAESLMHEMRTQLSIDSR
jgi:tetratricopeptide (TPR) repeat protein